MALLDALGQRLEADGIGTLAVDIFLTIMPDTPDLCVLLVEDNGTGPTHTYGASAYAIQRPRIRAFVRGPRNDYPAARDTLVSVRGSLGAIRDETISGVSFMSVTATSDLYPVSRDGDDRPIVGVDFVGFIL